MHSFRPLMLTLLITGLLAPAWAGSQVIVNGEVLDPETHRGLEDHYRTRLIPGRYWYDRVSGLWGLEGGPSQGQIVAGLRMGRALAADASVKSRFMRTGVFVNGREIHALELRQLIALFGSVPAGRYWLNPNGIAGHERGPPQWDLRAAAMKQRAPRSSPGYGQRGVFGNMASDGNCGYYNDPSSGASVMAGNC